MKHLRTFEQYSGNDELNENIWRTAKKAFTGHETKADRDAKREDILKQLDDIEEVVKENPEGWSFNRASLEKAAEKNNYRGELRTQRGGRNTHITYVVWDNKATGFQDIAGAASFVSNRPPGK